MLLLLRCTFGKACMRIPHPSPSARCRPHRFTILGGCEGEESRGKIPGKSTTMQQHQRQQSRPRQPASVTSCASGSPAQRFTCHRGSWQGPIPMHTAGRMRKLQLSGHKRSVLNRPIHAINTKYHHSAIEPTQDTPPGTLLLILRTEGGIKTARRKTRRAALRVLRSE